MNWPGWLAPMDPAAQATCLEIGFGLNTVYSTFENFRRAINDEVKHCSTACQAFVGTIEGMPSPAKKKLLLKISAIGERHITFQNFLLACIRPIALVFAFLCIAVLYNGWMAWLGWYTFFLMVPVPLHAALSVINTWIMRTRMTRRINKYSKARNLYTGKSEELELFSIPPLSPAGVPAAVNPAFGPAEASKPPLEISMSQVSATVKARIAWRHAATKFATERPLEAETIYAVQFLSAKQGILQIMVPSEYESRLFFLKSPRNIALLEREFSDAVGESYKIQFLTPNVPL